MSSPDAALSSRAEYLSRIHRVMDHIERNLEGPLGLEELARVACFSPWHFHRIFSAVAGESLYQFILRLRLERAACQLIGSPGKSITAVALDCGFGSSATFARAFRAAFGQSASAWRDEQRKKSKTDRKAGKDLDSSGNYVASVAEAQDAEAANPRRQSMTSPSVPATKEAQSTRIETIGPMPVAYVRHVGPYAGDSALFEKLMGKLMRWAGPRGLLGPSTKVLFIYHDNPEITAEDKLRISACVTVPPETKAEGEVGRMEIPAGKYVVATFELAVEEYGAAWAWLMGTWMPSSGYQPDDRPCFELALNDPKTHPQGKHVVEIWEPIKPL